MTNVIKIKSFNKGWTCGIYIDGKGYDEYKKCDDLKNELDIDEVLDEFLEIEHNTAVTTELINLIKNNNH